MGEADKGRGRRYLLSGRFLAEGRKDDNKEGRKSDLERYHAMGHYCSTPDFLVVTSEEIAIMGKDLSKQLIPYHFMILPSKPLLYSRWRDDDQEFAEILPDGPDVLPS